MSLDDYFPAIFSEPVQETDTIISEFENLLQTLNKTTEFQFNSGDKYFLSQIYTKLLQKVGSEVKKITGNIDSISDLTKIIDRNFVKVLKDVKLRNSKNLELLFGDKEIRDMLSNNLSTTLYYELNRS